MKNLHDLEPEEVSLVPKGANLKKILLFKEHTGGPMTKEEIRKLAVGDPKVMAKVQAVIKEYKEMHGHEMPEQAQTALKAAARILSPHKDSIPGDVLHGVMEAAGLGGHSDAGGPGDGTAGRNHEGDVDDVDKLGAPKYPEKQPDALLNKAKKPHETDEDDDEEDDEDDIEKNKGGYPMSKILKADGTLDMTSVPAAVRPAVELLWKSQSEAVAKAAELEKQLTVEKTARVEKEFKEKAEGYKHLGMPTDKIAKILKSASERSADELTDLEEILKGLDVQAANGKLFEEIGSNLGEGNPNAKMDAEIAKAAEAWVQKSGEKISKEEAQYEFLKSPEGQKMYAKYKAQRPGGI